MEIGNERVVKEFKKYTGVGEFSVLGFNLNRQQIIDTCGYDPKAEPDYLKPNKDGVKGNNLTVFLKEKKVGATMRVSFNLYDKEVVSKANNKRYVNAKCQNTYVNPLPEWFAKHENRPAYEGEADFLLFMRAWLSNFDWRDEGAGGARFPLKESKLVLDGSVTGINGLAKRYNNQTVGVLCGVRTTEKGDRQDTCNRAFLPGYLVSEIQKINKGLSEEDRNKQQYNIKEFIRTVEGEYGYKYFYNNSYKFMEYDPATNVVSGNNESVLGSDIKW